MVDSADRGVGHFGNGCVWETAPGRRTYGRIEPNADFPGYVPYTGRTSTIMMSRGDAQAIFQASPNGFWAIQLHSPVLQGAPSDAQARGAIRPEPFNDGQHYCAVPDPEFLDEEKAYAPPQAAARRAGLEDVEKLLTDSMVALLDGAELAACCSSTASWPQPHSLCVQVGHGARLSLAGITILPVRTTGHPSATRRAVRRQVDARPCPGGSRVETS